MTDTRLFTGSGYLLWTFVTLLSAFFILADVLGTAAWAPRMNLALALYLLFAITGFFGLFAGFRAPFSTKPVYAWTTFLGAAAIACLSVIFACDFIWGRNKDVPLSDGPIYFGHFRAPLLALYGAALFCCSVEALVHRRFLRQHAHSQKSLVE